MIATSGSRADVSFDAEPMEWRLIAGCQSGWTDFHVRVLPFQGLSNPPSPETEGSCLFDAQCSAESFADAVLAAAQKVWDEYGADGYDQAWGGPCGFPLGALNALKTAISIQEPRPQKGWMGSRS
jgi:hypothetical protein